MNKETHGIVLRNLSSIIGNFAVYYKYARHCTVTTQELLESEKIPDGRRTAQSMA
jgi:hypothetical protein